MFRLICCALLVYIVGATAFPVEVPQDAAVIGKPFKIGEVYMMQVFQPVRYNDDDEMSNFIPTGDYNRPPQPSVLLGFVPPPLQPHKQSQDYFPMREVYIFAYYFTFRNNFVF